MNRIHLVPKNHIPLVVKIKHCAYWLGFTLTLLLCRLLSMGVGR